MHASKNVKRSFTVCNIKEGKNVYGMNWLDIAAIILLLFFVLQGSIKGFVLSIFNTLGFILSLIAAKMLSPYVSAYISNDTYIFSKISSYCSRKASTNSAAAFVFKFMSGGKTIGSTIANGLVVMASFIIVFFIVKIILNVLSNALNIISKLPVLKQFNRVLGMVVGLIKGILILYIIFALLTPVLPLLKSTNPVISALENSRFAVNFYRYNIITELLKSKPL